MGTDYTRGVSRRDLLCAGLAAAGGTLSFAASGEGATATARPIVGAIRWDAWHGDASSVGLTVEKTLGPARWHYRLPFYAREISPTEVRVRGDSQAVTDREIAYAHAAGLDYWAFVTYPPDLAMSRGLDLYLASKHKRDLRFCLDLQSGWIAQGGAAGWPNQVERYVRLFREPSYQRVLGRRPLVFLLLHDSMVGERLFASWSEAARAIADLRAASHSAGAGDPYIVGQHWSPREAKKVCDLLGLDAVGAYAVQSGAKHAPYAALAAYAERTMDGFRGTGAHVVPLVMSGWDRRPRVENPTPWEPAGGDMEQFYEAPKPEELADHLAKAIHWTEDHPECAEAHAVLIYAWNEFDEGGWIAPTISEGSARLDAIGRVLRNRR